MEKEKSIKPPVPKNFNAGLAVTISIPKNIGINCAEERILCLVQDANFMETSSGLKVATTIGQDDPDGKKTQQAIKRYFVVAAGVLAKKMKYRNEEGKKKIRIRKGDEIIMALNPDSTAYFPPTVTDFSSVDKNGAPAVYYAFDRYEITGVIRHNMDFSGDYKGLRKWWYKLTRR